MADQNIDIFSGIMPAEPLWKIAPTRDAEGKSYVDFMMIIPKLKTRPRQYIDNTLSKIQMVLAQYSHVVVFANMNLKINCLWVSHKAWPGMCTELAQAIRHQVPEATLVGDFRR